MNELHVDKIEVLAFGLALDTYCPAEGGYFGRERFERAGALALRLTHSAVVARKLCHLDTGAFRRFEALSQNSLYAADQVFRIAGDQTRQWRHQRMLDGRSRLSLDAGLLELILDPARDFDVPHNLSEDQHRDQAQVVSESDQELLPGRQHVGPGADRAGQKGFEWVSSADAMLSLVGPEPLKLAVNLVSPIGGGLVLLSLGQFLDGCGLSLLLLPAERAAPLAFAGARLLGRIGQLLGGVDGGVTCSSKLQGGLLGHQGFDLALGVSLAVDGILALGHHAIGARGEAAGAKEHGHEEQEQADEAGKHTRFAPAADPRPDGTNVQGERKHGHHAVVESGDNLVL